MNPHHPYIRHDGARKITITHASDTQVLWQIVARNSRVLAGCPRQGAEMVARGEAPGSPGTDHRVAQAPRQGRERRGWDVCADGRRAVLAPFQGAGR